MRQVAHNRANSARNRRPLSIGVLALVPDRWGGPYMPRHQILLRLSEHFPVVWLDFVLPWQHHLLARRTATPNIPGRPNFVVHVPARIHGEYFKPRWLSRWAQRARLRSAADILRRAGCEQPVLYLWRPDFGYALDAYRWAMTVYHIDDEYSFSEQSSPISDTERDVIERSDHVIVHSTGLEKTKGHINPNTSLIPNGVDYAAYTTPQPEPRDMQGIARPRVGYAGVIKKQLDLELLIALARRHTDVSILMVGPVNEDHDIADSLATLRRLDNVHFLGNKHPDELPAYTQHFEVGLLPYRVNAYTHAIFPLKLHEYLASGIPVLSTPIQTAIEHNDVVHIAHGLEQWSQALTTLLADRGAVNQARAHRQSVAARYDWNDITERVAALIRRGVAANRSATRLEIDRAQGAKSFGPPS